MHSDLVCGVATHAGIATAMVSGNGYENRDVGGYAESYMGTDIAVLAAPGSKDQDWNQARIAPLVRAQAAGSLLRLFRQHGEHIYRYCGLYRIADRWKCRVQFSEPGKPIQRGNKTCFVKLERVPGQLPVEPVVQFPKDTRRKDQLEETICNL